MSKIKRFHLSPITLLLVAFVLLAVFYSCIIPLFEGPDEDDHFRYARFISQYGALPVQLFEQGGGIAGHQGWQPPLYYTLIAALISPIDTSDFPQHLWRNYEATFVGDPACCGRNIYYHTASEDFPFTGTTLAVHLARLLSVVFGAVTVWALYALVHTILPDRRQLAIAAASIAAFNPSFLFSSALVSNDVALAAFSSLALLVLVGLLCSRVLVNQRTTLVLGGLIGCAILTKTTAIALVPVTLLVLGVVAWRRNSLRVSLSAATVMLAEIALLTGWWFVRNWGLYGDPLAYRLMTVSALFPRSGPLTTAELMQISIPWLWQTFWGGPTPGDFPIGLLLVLLIFAGIGLFGSVVFWVSNKQFETRAAFLLCAGWLALILVAQVQFIRTTVGADQGRYLFPALGALVLLLATGWDTLAGLVSSSLRSITRVGIIGGFAALALYVPFALTLAAYARPPLVTESEIGGISYPMTAEFAGRIELLGFDMDAREAKPGENVAIALYWRALASMDDSYRVFVHLIGANDRVGGGADVVPGRGAFPTVYWKPGEIFRDTVRVPLPREAIPGKYAIEIGWYPVGKPDERLAVRGSDEDRVIISNFKIAPAQNLTYSPSIRTSASFGDKADLIGYDVSAGSDRLDVTLYWQSRAAWERDYTVFVHLVDRDGNIVAQRDHEPQYGNYPTSIWSPGEQVRDDYVLDVARGDWSRYKLEVGMYRADTLERLPARVDGRLDDHIELPLPETLR